MEWGKFFIDIQAPSPYTFPRKKQLLLTFLCGFQCSEAPPSRSVTARESEAMLDARCWIRKKKNSYFHPVSRDKRPVSRGNKQQLLAIPKT
jgi:hypothetical protein